MALDFSLVTPGLLSASPLTVVSKRVLAESAAVNFTLRSEGYHGRDTEVNMESWPVNRGFVDCLVRFESQREGCFFDCNGCDAFGPGKNYPAEHMVYQVLTPLTSGDANLETMSRLQIASFGTGEPFLNAAVPEAISELHRILPGASFMLSTSGPRAGRKVFDLSVHLVVDGIDLDLQVSINLLSQDPRLRHLGSDLNRAWTLDEISALVREWFARTGRKVHISFFIGDAIPLWGEEDYANLVRLFSPDHVVVKLSFQGKGAETATSRYGEEMSARERGLLQRGYCNYRFILPAITCGHYVNIKV